LGSTLGAVFLVLVSSWHFVLSEVGEVGEGSFGGGKRCTGKFRTARAFSLKRVWFLWDPCFLECISSLGLSQDFRQLYAGVEVGWWFARILL